MDATAAGLVDLDAYPILRLDAPEGRSLVQRAAGQLAATGACELPGFLTPAGLAACVADGRSLAPEAYASSGVGTAYLERPSPGWPDGHPRARWCPYATGVVAYDQFSASSPIRALYEWDPLVAFLAAVLERPVHRYADPLGALNLAVMGDRDQLQWHYDQTDFVVSLALQASTAGGAFEVVPRLRADGDERYDEVTAAIDGTHPGVVTLAMTPGTLLLFAGRHSLHRVSPIEGDTDRLVVLCGYDTQPGTRSSEALQLARYGRTA